MNETRKKSWDFILRVGKPLEGFYREQICGHLNYHPGC